MGRHRQHSAQHSAERTPVRRHGAHCDVVELAQPSHRARRARLLDHLLGADVPVRQATSRRSTGIPGGQHEGGLRRELPPATTGRGRPRPPPRRRPRRTARRFAAAKAGRLLNHGSRLDRATLSWSQAFVQNQNAGAFLLTFCVCALVILAVVLAIYIFFCLTLMRTQKEVHPRNQLIPPGLVWLHMLHLGGGIPILGIIVSIGASIWDLIMILKLSGSLKLEFEDRGWSTDEGFGRPVGLVWTVGQLVGAPIGLAMNLMGPQQFGDPAVAIGVGGALVAYGLAIFICWIIYWVQMAGYGRRLREDRGTYRYGSVEADYDDDYQPRHRRDDDDFDDRRDRDQADRPELGRHLPKDD